MQGLSRAVDLPSAPTSCGTGLAEVGEEMSETIHPTWLSSV